MLKAIVNDPFWVPHKQARKLTDRQKWELYLEPRLREQRAAERLASRTPDDDDLPDNEEVAEVVDDKGHQLSGEAVLHTLVAAGFMHKADADRVIREKQAMMGE